MQRVDPEKVYGGKIIIPDRSRVGTRRPLAVVLISNSSIYKSGDIVFLSSYVNRCLPFEREEAEREEDPGLGVLRDIDLARQSEILGRFEEPPGDAEYGESYVRMLTKLPTEFFHQQERPANEGHVSLRTTKRGARLDQ